MPFSLEIELLLGTCLYLALSQAAGWLLVRHSKRMALRLSRSLSPSFLSISSHFPRFVRYLHARLDPLKAEGLPLTLLLIALFFSFLLLVGITEELLTAEKIALPDKVLNQWLDSYLKPAVIAIFSWLTGLGAGITLLAVAFVSSLFFLVYRRPYLLPAFWITIAGAEITTWLGKFAVARVRPDFVTGVTAISYSFPSGHAAGSVAVYGFIAYALARDLHGRMARFEMCYWFFNLVLLIGCSRVLLHVHYVSDVVAGFLTGLVWLLAGVAIGEYRLGRNRLAGGQG
jgi:membrane-associated phospholipid phosphatase